MLFNLSSNIPIPFLPFSSSNNCHSSISVTPLALTIYLLIILSLVISLLLPSLIIFLLLLPLQLQCGNINISCNVFHLHFIRYLWSPHRKKENTIIFTFPARFAYYSIWIWIWLSLLQLPPRLIDILILLLSVLWP